MHSRIFIDQLESSLNQDVQICGFVHSKRDHGKVIFLDISDNSGQIQCVMTASQEFFTLGTNVKEQSSVIVDGKVAVRPDKLKTEGINGNIELQITDFKIVNMAIDLPWSDSDSKNVNEELRMKYRYLDLRNQKNQDNLKLRSQVLQFIRTKLHDQNFTEIETPYITKGTPEGAREYIIPSRQHPGNFYALPQSPQQFKQLLMVGGIDRYFSIARCFRDEDTRGDRQAEFTQLDMELSYPDQEMIISIIEKLFTELVEELLPHKKLTSKPFTRLTYAESMDKYGTDKPDLRLDKNDPNELAFCWITDWPLFEHSKSENKLVAMHHLFTRPQIDSLELLESAPEKALAECYDIVLNGYEIGGGSIRIHERDLQEKIFKLLNIGEQEIKSRFGHMLKAFEYGAPPHGGIACGIDRIMMILCNEPSIREVIAFPKTGDGRDLLMGAPAAPSVGQLKELGLKILES